MLHALARSAADVNDLDHGAVLDAVVTAAVRIGDDSAAFLVLRDGGAVMVEHAGVLTADQTTTLVPDDLVACLTDDTARTVEVDGVSMLCLPVVVGDRAVGALVGAAHDEDVDPDGVGLRILVAHAATALTNAHRFRSTRELVDQLHDVERLRHDLVSTASHELRTPTTVIKAAELLDGRWADLEDAERRRFVQRIHSHARALEHVLDQLAAFVDLDTGTISRLDAAPLDLAELVETCIARSRDALLGHTVVTRLAPVEVTGDAASLRRAVSAVLDNVEHAHARRHHRADRHRGDRRRPQRAEARRRRATGRGGARRRPARARRPRSGARPARRPTEAVARPPTGAAPRDGRGPATTGRSRVGGGVRHHGQGVPRREHHHLRGTRDAG